jgi:hypothetical protein
MTDEVEVDLPGVHDLMAFAQAEQNVISLRRSKRSGVPQLERS